MYVLYTLFTSHEVKLIIKKYILEFEFYQPHSMTEIAAFHLYCNLIDWELPIGLIKHTSGFRSYVNMYTCAVIPYTKLYVLHST